VRPGSIPLFARAHLVFACKTFLAAALALVLALWLDLPRPYWAMATVYITSNPLAGATSSKAFYHVLGTLAGGAAAVVIIPNLANAPEFLCLAIALWVGFCLYLSLLDRTPRGHMFMLAGYTVGLIGFPSVSDPASMFDTALARVEEITLGITCATLVSTIVLPQSVAAAAVERVNRWLSDARRLCVDVLSGRDADPAHGDQRLRLAGDIVDIDTLAGHLAYDGLADANVVRGLRVIRSHMVMLLPPLAAIGGHIAALTGGSREEPSGLAGSLDDLLDDLLDNLAPRFAADSGAPPSAETLHAVIDSHYPKLDAHSSWTEIAMANLLIRLRELVDIWHDCQALSRAIAAGDDVSRLELAFPPEAGAVPGRHRDHGVALWAATGAAIAILLCSAMLVATGWADGTLAPMMAAVACSLLAARDDPTPGVRSFGWLSLVSIVVVAVYLFAIMPAISNIELLIAALAPPFLFFGFLAARPPTASAGAWLGTITAILLALQSTYVADFETYANSSLAFLCGMVVAVVVMKLARSAGVAWVARRLMKTNWETLALTAERRGRNDRPVFVGVMLDRLGLLAQRFAVVPETDRRDVDSLTQLRVGLNIIDLRRARRGLTAATLSAIDDMLDQLAAASRRGLSRPMPAALLAHIDLALTRALDESDGKAKEDALIGLAGIRHGLFPNAPAYQPQS
jgi:uncharacterized membrane protein YccC